MSALMKLAVLFIWMAGMPVLCGLVPCLFLPAEKRTPVRIILSGYLFTFAIFECLAIPVLLFTPLGDFELLVRLFAVCSILAAGFGVFETVRTGGVAPAPGKGTGAGTGLSADGKGAGTLYAVFLILLVFELAMGYTHASFDGDDAYYVTQSVLSYQTGTMYRYLPYTGITTEVDFRHALSMFPMWTAALGRLSRTHPAVIAHSMQPFVLIPLSDLALFSLAGELFDGQENRERKRALFMVVIAVLQIFGNVSIYTPETFLLTRTWQGKSVMVSFILPCGLYLLMTLSRGAKDEYRHTALMMFLLHTAACLMTSMAPVLLILMMSAGAAGLYLFGVNRETAILKTAALTAVPGILFLILYLAVR